jgi:cytochrome c oxidase subunit 2
VIRFTAKPDEPDPPQVYGNRRIELIWTLIPTFILMVAFVFTAYDINAINTPAKAAGININGTKQSILNINAIGHQWWWEFQYPTLPGVITADEVHVPTGITIHFHVESGDVIHSFWVPQIARQIDANPGQDNAIFVPPLTQTGIYSGACYEYCGTAHAWMKFRLVVQSPALFNAWFKHQMQPAARPTTGLEAAGYKIFMANTCVECHAITGTPAGGAVGPNLTHLASRWTIGAGAAPMTESALAAWVHNPNTFKPGVLMPGYPLFSSKDLKALAAYLYSLK